eukprot:TRINITY_DN41825_c0_g1_i12.p4 TRINITY_DN41825_c0_g1~~TRINITY_DN41825_c0_g1_i12.p4  ORF type:complete len:205 (+),score=-6.94 TRINITY_DN41825_c0_g1_i12:2171-2785(+)
MFSFLLKDLCFNFVMCNIRRNFSLRFVFRGKREVYFKGIHHMQYRVSLCTRLRENSSAHIQYVLLCDIVIVIITATINIMQQQLVDIKVVRQILCISARQNLLFSDRLALGEIVVLHIVLDLFFSICISLSKVCQILRHVVFFIVVFCCHFQIDLVNVIFERFSVVVFIWYAWYVLHNMDRLQQFTICIFCLATHQFYLVCKER